MHPVEVVVGSALLGRVVVRWRASLSPRWGAVSNSGWLTRDIPDVVGRDYGVDLRHLTFRPDNRPKVAAFLAMVLQSRTGLAATTARVEADAILDAILHANAEYYRRLDELVVAAGDEGPITGMLAAVSILQQQRLSTMWA